VSYHFLPCERDQPYLMPASLREWLPDDHLAWFVLDVVEEMDLAPFYARYRSDGWGAAAFEPGMMVALLLYAYCIGERSSRRIERRCTEDVAFRVIAANQVPDHATIARFRQSHGAALAHCFIEILRLCRAAGLGQVGLVAVDGTKVEANASLRANHTVETIERKVERMLAEAAQTDAEEDARHGAARGDELPDELRERGGRLERLRQARARLEAEEAERQRDYQEQLARRAALEAERGRPLRGRKPVLKRPRSASSAQANTTDPESRVMKQGPTLIQGYNAQAVVTADQIVVAAELVQEANDRRQLRPMLARAQGNLAAAGSPERIGTLLADAGYWSDREIEPLLDDRDAPRLLVATEMHPTHRTKQTASARLRARMRRRLSSRRGQALYAKRPQICEPVFGEIKWTRGARRFMGRGLGACAAEWKLLCATNNLRKLWRARAREAVTR
jgi:transposase